MDAFIDLLPRCVLHLWAWYCVHWACKYLYKGLLTRCPDSAKVERGVITKNTEVEIVGLGDSLKTTLTGIGTHEVQ